MPGSWRQYNLSDLGALHGIDLQLPWFDVAGHTKQLGMVLRRILEGANESFGLAVLSDSTGDGTNPPDWPYIVGSLIAASNELWTVRHTVYSTGSESYPAPTTIQTGQAGERFVRFVTASSQSLQIPNGDVGSYTDLDIQMKVSLDDWSPATIMTLASHFGAAGQRSWEFIVKTSGTLALSYSNDGTTIVTDTSTVVTGITDGTIKWVRCTFQGNDGAGNRKTSFYTSNDGITWTQLGTTVTTAGTQTLSGATSTPYEIGARQASTQTLTGNIYEVRLKSAIDGASTNPVVAPCFPEHWSSTTSGSSPSPTGAPILHLSFGAISGQGLAYLSDPTRLPKLLPDYSHRAVFMATSHNETNQIGKSWLSSWSSWISAVKTQATHCTPVILTENPRVGSASWIREHTQRREKLLGLAAQLGLPAIDAYQAFLDTGNPSAYIQGDGIHPTSTGASNDGSHVWGNYVYQALFGKP